MTRTWIQLLVWTAFLGMALGPGCATTTTLPAGTDPGDLLIVDCLLPGKVRQLGTQLTYLSARRPLKTSGRDCAIRGGEYTAYDRSSYASALKVWMPAAQGGNPEAQTYVGEIYEKGVGGRSDFEAAALWYRKAAEQGHAAAMIDLGQLYEQGRGVPRDAKLALDWYRRASGLEGRIAFVPSGAMDPAESDAEIKRLRGELEEQRVAAEALRGELRDLRAQPPPADPGVSTQREAEIAAKLQTLERKQRELAGIDARIRARARKLDEQQQQLARRETEAARLARQIEERRVQLGDLEASREQSTDAIALRHAAITRLDAELDQLATQRERAARDKQEKIAELDAQIFSLAKRAERLGLSAAAAENEQSELARLRAEAEVVTASRVEIAGQKSREIDALSREIERLRKTAQDLGTHEGELERRGRELEELRGEVAELERRREDASRSLQRELEQKNRQVAALNREVAENLTMLASQEAEVASKQGELTSLGEQLDTLAAERERATREARERIEALNAEIDQLSAKAADLTGQGTQAEQKRQEMALRIADLGAEIERMEAQAAGLRRQIAVAIAGPTIEMLDPRVPRTRGTRIVRAAAVDSDRQVMGRVVAPAGLTSLTVNERPVGVAETGIFESKVRVDRSGRSVSIVAIDRQGKLDRLEFTLHPDGAPEVSNGPPSLARSLDFGRYHALVIGNDAYRNLSTLHTAVKDARAVADVLRGRYGFEVTELYNADRYATMAALNELRQTLSSDDNLLIYYAGHGELDRVNMRGSWLPVDAERDSTANWISNVSLTDILNSMKARHVLVIADSCYSGTLTRAALARLEAGSTTEERARWIEQMASKRSRTALTSGALLPVLDGGSSSDHSIFAAALIQVLEENADVMEGQQLYLQIAARVGLAADRQRVEQTPQYAPIKHGGHEAGDFFFVPKRDVAGRPITTLALSQ